MKHIYQPRAPHTAGHLFWLLSAWSLAVAILCSLRAASAGEASPARQGASTAPTAVFEACDYADDAAARAAWRPLTGTPQADSVVDGQRRVARLPCHFAHNPVERASWDLGVNLNLSDCRGIEFQISCANLAPISSFSLYFQSGNGWYNASFYPSAPGWNTIVIDKASTKIEGQPDGWNAIKAIRLAAWRGGDTDTELRVRNFAFHGKLGADATVAIIRAESVAVNSKGEARSIDSFAESMARYLDTLGIGYAMLSDIQLEARQLEKVRVLILPYNPSMPADSVQLVERFIRGGGKAVGFYALPHELYSTFGIEAAQYIRPDQPDRFAAIRIREGQLPGAPPVVGQHSWNIYDYEVAPGVGHVVAEWLDGQNRPTGKAAIVATANTLAMSHVLLDDDPVNKRRLVQAMLGQLAPQYWREAATAALAGMGRVGGADDYATLARNLRRDWSDDPRVQRALTEADRLRAQAERLLAEGKLVDAFNTTATAGQQALAAYARGQRCVPGEFRGLWCHNARGVTGLSWDQAIKQMADAHFTAIFPNMLWGGVAFYPSDLLPTANGIDADNDQIAQCLAACRKYGIQIHVWKVNWNTGSQAPKSFVDAMRRERRLQVDINGHEDPWLCPSHPANQKLEVDSMVEVARRYAVDGLHFDYIRYPSGAYCYCPGCRQRFSQAIGTPVNNWPGDVRPDGALRQQWLDWRRQNINAVVEEVSRQARQVRPGIKLSAAVFRNWTSDRDGVGQDWKLWCERGWMDFVCPMDYTPSDVQLGNSIANQLGWAGKTPCYPGLGVFQHGARERFDHLVRQIEVTREHNTGGFMVFDYSDVHAHKLLPLLGEGATRLP